MPAALAFSQKALNSSKVFGGVQPFFSNSAESYQRP